MYEIFVNTSRTMTPVWEISLWYPDVDNNEVREDDVDSISDSSEWSVPSSESLNIDVRLAADALLFVIFLLFHVIIPERLRRFNIMPSVLTYFDGSRGFVITTSRLNLI